MVCRHHGDRQECDCACRIAHLDAGCSGVAVIADAPTCIGDLGGDCPCDNQGGSSDVCVRRLDTCCSRDHQEHGGRNCVGDLVGGRSYAADGRHAYAADRRMVGRCAGNRQNGDCQPGHGDVVNCCGHAHRYRDAHASNAHVGRCCPNSQQGGVGQPGCRHLECGGRRNSYYTVTCLARMVGGHTQHSQGGGHNASIGDVEYRGASHEQANRGDVCGGCMDSGFALYRQVSGGRAGKFDVELGDPLAAVERDAGVGGCDMGGGWTGGEQGGGRESGGGGMVGGVRLV